MKVVFDGNFAEGARLGPGVCITFSDRDVTSIGLTGEMGNPPRKLLVVLGPAIPKVETIRPSRAIELKRVHFVPDLEACFLGCTQDLPTSITDWLQPDFHSVLEESKCVLFHDVLRFT
jgi:hypothetical protein